MKYRIIVTETLSKVIEIDSATSIQALDEVNRMYRNEELVLTADDYEDTEFTLI